MTKDNKRENTLIHAQLSIKLSIKRENILHKLKSGKFGLILFLL